MSVTPFSFAANRLRLAAGAALALVAFPALAADFDGPYPPRPTAPVPDFHESRAYPPPPPPVPGYGPPRFAAGPHLRPPEDGCRVFVRRRFDADGEPVIRRVRVCDERPFMGGPRAAAFDGPPPPPRFERPEGRWDHPRW